MNECVTDDECRWDYICASGNCSILEGYCDDIASPNGEYIQAYSLMIPSTLDDLTLCDDDYFSVNLEVGDEVTWRVNFSNDEGEDIDITLYEPNGSPVRFGTDFSDTEEVTYTAQISGVHTLKVFGYNDFSSSLPLLRVLSKRRVNLLKMTAPSLST